MFYEVTILGQNDEVAKKVEELKAQLEALKATPVKEAGEAVKKNHKPSKPQSGRKYVLLSKSLNAWGRVPQQQADIAKLLSDNMEVGAAYTEEEVFGILESGAAQYKSLSTSKQDPTYLFRYYRGLRNDGKHAGYTARNFLQMRG